MSTWLFALVLLSSPSDPTPPDVDRARLLLLERARDAASRKDLAAVAQALRGWASLGGGGSVPLGLEGAASEALRWVEDVGRFRVFASRLPDRVRVGVHDPAGLSSRIEAYAYLGDELLRLPRMALEAPDRFEYRTETSEAVVRVEAILTVGGEDVILARVEVEPASLGALPAAPDPRARAGVRVFAAPRPQSTEPALSPWWYALGALAVVLAGAALAQEARF